MAVDHVAGGDYRGQSTHQGEMSTTVTFLFIRFRYVVDPNKMNLDPEYGSNTDPEYGSNTDPEYGSGSTTLGFGIVLFRSA